ATRRHLHLEKPQSRQKSQPLACSSWPLHSGQMPIMVDMIAPVTFAVAGCCLPIARAESGLPVRRRLVIMMHSATACSGEVSNRSLNQTACVPVTLLRLYATSAASKPPRSIFDASNPTPPLIGPV